MDLQLQGSSIVVTGGSSGIGLETARLLLSEGALVTICGRDPDRLAAAEADLDSSKLLALPANVLDSVQAATLISAAVQRWGTLDGVAAVAGEGSHGNLIEMEQEAVAREVADKLASLLNVVRPAISSLIESSGAVVGLTAPTALRPDIEMGAIGVGRAALDNALKALAIELAPQQVRVNAVGVGIIDTPRQEIRHERSGSNISYPTWLLEQAKRRTIPLARPGTATEVGAAICWLLSPVCGYTTGGVLDVTGGHASR